MAADPDHDALSLSKGELAHLSDEEILALAEAFSPAAGELPTGQPARRGLDLVRLAAANAPLIERSSKETGPQAAGDTHPVAGKTSALPSRIGRFEVVRELGQGGFGVVLLALDPVLNRPVALKVPKPQALVSPEARSRFEREARAAAMLSHPGIVPLHETGLDEPIQYIVFGYVAGESLATLLGRSGPLEPRLAAATVARLADAVGHAHQRGVVHRDLKPGNVLLHYQGSRVPERTAEWVESLRIADFGLAKLPDPESAGLTREGSLLGTPSYMSPEQAAGRDDLVGPASDLYGLGAILYELLTGRPPFREATDVATLRAVEARAPQPPRSLRPQLSRDLEAICLKCLEKNPAARYSHAADLSADLQRWLQGEPVRARRITALGRIGRWGRRNPALAAAVSLAACSLTVGLAVTMIQQQQLREQLQVITAEKNRADQQSDRAKRSEAAALGALEETQKQRSIAERHYLISNTVRGFLYEDLLGQANPVQQLASLTRLRSMGLDDFDFSVNPTLQDLVTRVLPRLSEEQLERRFPDQPVVQAELLTTVGRVLLNQRMESQAVPLFQRARELYSLSGTTGEPDSSRRECDFLLGTALTATGQLEPAESIFRELLSSPQDQSGQAEADLDVRWRLAELERRRGNDEQATRSFREILGLCKEHFEPDSPQRRKAVNLLADHLLQCELPGEAAATLIEEYPGVDSIRHSADPAELTSQSLLARAWLAMNEVPKALPLLQDNFETRRDLQGAGYPETFLAQLVLAEAQFRSGDQERAMEAYREILARAEQLLGANSPVRMNATNNLATLHWKRGELDRSIPLLEQVCEWSQQQHGPHHPTTLFYLANLGVNYRDAGLPERALPLLQTVAAHCESVPRLHWSRKELVHVWMKLEQWEPAEEFCRQWIAGLAGPKAAPVTQLFDSHQCLGKILLAQGKPGEAEQELREALRLGLEGEVRLAASYWPVDQARTLLGLALLDQSRAEEAIPLLDAGCRGLVASRERIPKVMRNEALQPVERLIDACQANGKTELAEQWREQQRQWQAEDRAPEPQTGGQGE